MISRNEILHLITKTAKEKLPGVSINLFGSYARGDQRDDSDVDLLVLIDKEHVDMYDTFKIEGALYDVELQTGIIIAPMIYTRKEWAMHNITPYSENVNRERIALV